MCYRYWLLMVCVVLLGFSSVVGVIGVKLCLVEVVVLVILYQMYVQVLGYLFDCLCQVIEQLYLDVLCLEVCVDKFVVCVFEQIKQEYLKVIYLLLVCGYYMVVVMELFEFEYGVILCLYVQVNVVFQVFGGVVVVVLVVYLDVIYVVLKIYWCDVVVVNDVIIDDMLCVKYVFQQVVIGVGECEGWECWNWYFFIVIKQVVVDYLGQCIVVMVGVEYGYWLCQYFVEVVGFCLFDIVVLFLLVFMQLD